MAELNERSERVGESFRNCVVAVFKVVFPSLPFYNPIERINCVKKTAFAIQSEKGLQGFAVDNKLLPSQWLQDAGNRFSRALEYFFLLMFINECECRGMRRKSSEASYISTITSPYHLYL